MVIDISASTIEKEPNFDLISKIAREVECPLLFRGIKNISQAQTLYIGVEKIGISSAILSNERFVSLANEIGNQVWQLYDLNMMIMIKNLKFFLTMVGLSIIIILMIFLTKSLQQPGEIIFNL